MIEATNLTEINGQSRFEELFNETENHNEITSWKILEQLEGDLDLGFLKDSFITDLEFHSDIESEPEHKIQSLTNLPPKLRRLVCQNQAIKDLVDLPRNLQELDVTGNKLSVMDFSNTPQLKIFRGSNNQLYQLSNLPASIEKLYVDHNQLSVIDLIGLENLQELDATYNSSIILEKLK